MDGELRTASQTNNDLDSIQALSANKFPFKLWKIVNECKSGSIKWNISGRNIIVHKSHFQEEYLDPMKKTFKTSNIGSFIRQLNLYGFKKVQPACKQYPSESAGEQEVQEFHNVYFRRGRPDLVNELRRHVGVRRAKADESRLQDHLSLGGPPAKILKSDPFSFVNTSTNNHTQTFTTANTTSQPPSLLAVPIFSDGIPYLNASFPPVLVEWDEAKKRWEPKGPAIGAVMNCNAGDKLPEGAQMGVTADCDSEKYGHLVAAVSDALRSVPEQELQACLGPKRENSDDQKEDFQPPQQIPSPIGVFPSDQSYDTEESPYPLCLYRTPILQPLCTTDYTDYSSTCYSPSYYCDRQENCCSPTELLENTCCSPPLRSTFSPLQRCSSPVLISPSLDYEKDFITLKFSPLSVSLSPITTQHEY